eukprot:gnl/TRDRNA2_/TRDRNA2_81766_c0_seq1.p1 gnl/TRDRNA2_/TRDRNA2_81766_c0~~gnl/TRDRNA2_/TRDRNA2_81766_c0_seq1.p1  ORF type:complete len:619 (-),score=139.71 gnl/TRDRNA2_/TRDRNA2_81766_c0_seq1:324-2180(-)
MAAALLAVGVILALPCTVGAGFEPVRKLEPQGHPKNTAEFIRILNEGKPVHFANVFESWLTEHETLVQRYSRLNVELCYSRNQMNGNLNRNLGMENCTVFRLRDAFFNRSQEYGFGSGPVLVEQDILDADMWRHVLDELPEWMLSAAMFIQPRVFAVAEGTKTITALHHDDFDNLVIHLHGPKKFCLYDFADIDYLDTSNWVPAYSRLSIKNVHLAGLTTDELYEEWAHPEKYIPSFAQATRYEVDLKPGDVLYIPRRWFHSGFNALGQSMSLASWFGFPNLYQLLFSEMFRPYISGTDHDEDDLKGKENREALATVHVRAGEERTLSQESIAKMPPETRTWVAPKGKSTPTRLLQKEAWMNMLDSYFQDTKECAKFQVDETFLPKLKGLVGKSSPVLLVFARLHVQLQKFTDKTQLNKLSAQWHLSKTAWFNKALGWEHKNVKKHLVPGMRRAAQHARQGAVDPPLAKMAHFFDFLFPGCKAKGDCVEMYKTTMALLKNSVKVWQCDEVPEADLTGDDAVDQEIPDEDNTQKEEEAEEGFDSRIPKKAESAKDVKKTATPESENHVEDTEDAESEDVEEDVKIAENAESEKAEENIKKVESETHRKDTKEEEEDYDL